jgi:hypothetical protein
MGNRGDVTPVVFLHHGHEGAIPPRHLKNLAKGEMMAEILQGPFSPSGISLSLSSIFYGQGKGF